MHRLITVLAFSSSASTRFLRPVQALRVLHHRTKVLFDSDGMCESNKHRELPNISTALLALTRSCLSATEPQSIPKMCGHVHFLRDCGQHYIQNVYVWCPLPIMFSPDHQFWPGSREVCFLPRPPCSLHRRQSNGSQPRSRGWYNNGGGSGRAGAWGPEGWNSSWRSSGRSRWDGVTNWRRQ